MPPVDNAYKLRNQEFLQEYAQKPGVKIMFNGVMYREITKGKGQKPSPKSFVTIPYNLGYGSRPAGAIKAFSTLIFDITLLDVR